MYIGTYTQLVRYLDTAFRDKPSFVVSVSRVYVTYYYTHIDRLGLP